MNEQVNSLQNQLFSLAYQVEATKNVLKEQQRQLEEVLLALGVNTYHQSPITGIVYKIYKPEGTFISFKSIDIKRTALPGETGGTVLSKKEAQEAGFVLR
jgi:hypothetical protein